MSTAAIYRIDNKKYLLYSNKIAVSGFSLASEPFIQVDMNNADYNTMTDAIKAILHNDDSKRIPGPKNWSEFNKSFLQKAGLKSSKELNKSTTIYCGIRKVNNDIIFTPTKHAEKPDEGFINKDKNESDVAVSYSASNQEILLALELALSKCE